MVAQSGWISAVAEYAPLTHAGAREAYPALLPGLGSFEVFAVFVVQNRVTIYVVMYSIKIGGGPGTDFLKGTRKAEVKHEI